MDITGDKIQVLTIKRQLTELMIKGDSVALHNILDTHFTLIHITGYVQSKAEWLSEIEREQMKYYSYTELKTSVEIEGKKAGCRRLLQQTEMLRRHR